MQSPTSRKMSVAALCAGAALALSGFVWWSQSSSANPTDSLPAGSFRVEVKKLVADDSSGRVSKVCLTERENLGRLFLRCEDPRRILPKM